MRIYDYLDEIRRALNAEESSGVPTPSWRIEEYLKDIYDAIRSGIYPSDEQVAEAIDAWLDDHPEATTTVQDGSITNAKLASSFVTPGTAAAYSSSATYAVGDYVFYDGALYRCITAITTAEAWTAAHWTAAVLGDDVVDLDNDIKGLQSDITRLEYPYTVNIINPDTVAKNYGISNLGTLEANTNYQTTDYIFVESGKSYTFSPKIRMYGKYRPDKSFIDRYLDSSVHTGNPYTFTATDDCYIRVAFFMSDGDTIQGEKGSTAHTFAPYGLQVQSQVNNLATAVASLASASILQRSKNLVDASAAEEGKAVASDGTLETNAYYITTDYIAVESGKTYTISPKLRMYATYDTSKTFIYRYNDGTVDTGNPYTFTASANGYIRISFFIANKTVMQMEEGSTATTYEPYGYSVENNADEALALAKNNVLYGKKWAVCGDSFTAGSESGTITDGLYAGKPKVYPYFIGNRNLMDIRQFFASGKTLAFPATPGDFTNSLTCSTSAMYYQNIPADIDYITIYLGINDEHHYTGSGDGESSEGYISLGTIDDNTTETYYGAWNVVLTWLRTNRPFAHIGIIITNGLSISDWYQAQINIAKKYGIPYLDLNGDQRTPAMIRSMNPDIASAIKTLINQKQAVNYSGGNLHPNDDAHKYESTFIEEFLRSI